MSTRRAFLRRFVTTSAGLLVAPDALELLVEPSRRFWPGADFGGGLFQLDEMPWGDAFYAYAKNYLTFLDTKPGA